MIIYVFFFILISIVIALVLFRILGEKIMCNTPVFKIKLIK